MMKASIKLENPICIKYQMNTRENAQVHKIVRANTNAKSRSVNFRDGVPQLRKYCIE